MRLKTLSLLLALALSPALSVHAETAAPAAQRAQAAAPYASAEGLCSAGVGGMLSAWHLFESFPDFPVAGSGFLHLEVPYALQGKS